ncbi:hypothetical protein [Streptomyces sp. NPDC004266]|uniref:hypothetical protein n=1 Tax=Streptomyces sp. NPDC004266 TaxID=3364693 RepID=UPI0036A5D593
MRTGAFRRSSGFLVLAAAVVLSASACAAEAQPSMPASASGPSAPPVASQSPIPASASEPGAVSSPAVARPARRLTAEELVEAALPVGTVPDLIGEPASVFHTGADGAEVKFLSGSTCREMLDAAEGEQTPAPAKAFQLFRWKGDVYGGSSLLASYEGSSAKEVFAKVREGLKTCRHFERQSPAGRYKATVSVLSAPRLGDEAVRFELAAPVELGPSVIEYTVVRVGSTVARFSKLSIAGRDVRAFPPVLIAEQVTRLQRAQG